MSARQLNKVTNADIYGVLMEIKEDIGGLKASSGLHLEGLRNHAERIGVLEGASQRQKGAVKVWGLIATGAATVVGGAIELFRH